VALAVGTAGRSIPVGGLHGQDSSKGYKTEWEARTNAFQRAKLLLVGPQDMPQGHLLEKA